MLTIILNDHMTFLVIDLYIFLLCKKNCALTVLLRFWVYIYYYLKLYNIKKNIKFDGTRIKISMNTCQRGDNKFESYRHDMSRVNPAVHITGFTSFLYSKHKIPFWSKQGHLRPILSKHVPPKCIVEPRFTVSKDVRCMKWGVST